MLETIPELQEDQEQPESLQNIVRSIEMKKPQLSHRDHLDQDADNPGRIFDCNLTDFIDGKTRKNQVNSCNKTNASTIDGYVTTIDNDCLKTSTITVALVTEKSKRCSVGPNLPPDECMNGDVKHDNISDGVLHPCKLTNGDAAENSRSSSNVDSVNCEHDCVQNYEICSNCKPDLSDDFMSNGDVNYKTDEISVYDSDSNTRNASDKIIQNNHLENLKSTHSTNSSQVVEQLQCNPHCDAEAISITTNNIQQHPSCSQVESNIDRLTCSSLAETCSGISGANSDVAYNSSDIENRLKCGSVRGELCNSLEDGLGVLRGCQSGDNDDAVFTEQVIASANIHPDCNASSSSDNQGLSNCCSGTNSMISMPLSQEDHSLSMPLTRNILQCGEFVRRYSSDSCCSDISLDSAGTLVVSEVSTLCSDEDSSSCSEDYSNGEPREFKCFGFHEGREESQMSKYDFNEQHKPHLDAELNTLDLPSLTERLPDCDNILYNSTTDDGSEGSSFIASSCDEAVSFIGSSCDEDSSLRTDTKAAMSYENDKIYEQLHSLSFFETDIVHPGRSQNGSPNQMLNENHGHLMDDFDDLYLMNTLTDFGIKIPCDTDLNIDIEYEQNLENLTDDCDPVLADGDVDTNASNKSLDSISHDFTDLFPLECHLDDSHLVNLSNDYTDFDSYIQVQLLMARLKKQNLIKEIVESGSVPSTMAGPAPGPAGKKQLPAIPDPETQQALSNKMAATKASSPRSANNSYGQFFVEYSLLAEYNELRKQKLPGVYVIPSAKSALHWNGVLFVRQGLYQEGIFRFSVQIPESYPDGESPRVIFDPPVFHPVINPDTGELDVKRAIHKWRRNVHKIWQVLLYTRRIFFKIDTKNPLNAQAAKLYEQDIEMFKKKVGETVSLSKARLNDPPDVDDAHAIVFSPYDDNLHDDYKSQMLKDKCHLSVEEEKSKNAQVSGLTWIKPGSLQVFSREDSATA